MTDSARQLGDNSGVGEFMRFQRGLFEGLPFPAALIDPSGHIVAVNPRWLATPALAAVLREGDPFFKHATKHNLFANADAVSNFLAILGGKLETTAAQVADGGWRLHASPVYEGEVRGLLLVGERLDQAVAKPAPDPASARQAAALPETVGEFTLPEAAPGPGQASFHAQLDSLAALAGGIAHDFNNLLTTILGYTHLALADLPPASPIRDFLTQVDKAARRAADLTQQLLTYAGRHVFAFQPVAVTEFIRELAPLLHSIVGRTHTLHLQLNEPLPQVQGDPQQLRQVLINLVDNAREALSDPGGAVTVRSGFLHLDRQALQTLTANEEATPGPYVFLEVADTGSGMTKDTMAHMFDPYFSTKFTGRGLGMAAVWGIVRSHGGLIKVDSTPGRGTIIQVLFPAQARR